MSFNPKEYEKKRLAARAAYLQKKTAQRQSAAQAVVNQRIEELQQGILLPTTVTEAELLVQRAKEVKVAKGLVSAVHAREEAVNSHLEEKRVLTDIVEVEQYFTPSSIGTAPIASSYVKAKQGTPLAKENRHEPVSSRPDSFLPLHEEEISNRLRKGDFVVEETVEEQQEQVLTALQQEQQRIRKQRLALPIFQVREAFLDLIRRHPVVVVVGETGSGKTTQLLQYLYEEGFHLGRRPQHGEIVEDRDSSDELVPKKKKKEEGEEGEEGVEEERRLICTQPRRIAAISVAKRVAQELGTRCGSLVGYKVRFDEKCGPHTRILYVTDGIMLKEFTSDPMMEQTAVIMVDEAHERSLNSDVLLGLLQDLVKRNTTLRVIVASATINAEKFSQFFGGTPIFTVTGRTFPVEIFYTEAPVADYVTEAAQTAMGIHLTKPLPGDILIFLPGQDAIEACMEALQQYATEAGSQIRPMLLLPMLAVLPPEEQGRIYLPTPEGVRKVVIATNIAETSITIDGVVYVIDCGLCKQTFYNAPSMTEELRVVPISQASALQRAGRAGRTQPGECFRLYTPFTFKNELPSDTIPELLRCSMTTVVLQLKVLGIDNLLQFEFLDAPSTASLEVALDQLFLLGAMKADGSLTVTGRRMAEIPLEPSWSKALIRAARLGCGRHMAMAASMLTLESVFIHSRDLHEKQRIESAKDVFFASSNGDAVGFVNMMEGWLRASSSTTGGEGREFCRAYGLQRGAMARARDVLDQLLSIMDRIGLDIGSPHQVVDPTARDAPLPPETLADEPLSTLAASPAIVHIEHFTKALLSGFFYNVARLESDKKTYKVVRGMESASASPLESDEGIDLSTVSIHPSSYLFKAGMPQQNIVGGGKGASQVIGGRGGGGPFQVGGKAGIPPVLRERPSLVVFTSLRYTSKRFMMNLTAIPSLEWVLESAPENYFQREMLGDVSGSNRMNGF